MSRPETKNRIDHMLLDTDFFEKPENVEAVDKFGDVAPSAILRLCLKLMNEKEASMRKSQVLAMWRASGTAQDVWVQIVDYYVTCGWLIEQDDCISSARVGKERGRVIQKRETLSANAKQKQSKSSAEPEQSESKSTDTVTDTELITKEVVEPPIQEVGFIRPGALGYVRFDQIAWDAFQMGTPKDVRERMIEIFEDHIHKQKKKDPQRFQELKLEALSGKSCLTAWAKSKAYEQIKNENAAAAREAKAIKPYEKPQDAPRPQPKEFIPQDLPVVTEEQKQANLAKIRDLRGRLSGAIR